MFVGISHVRNEADIIATSVQHHAAEGLDLLLIEDQGSSDGTWEILQKLAEDLPLVLTRDTRPLYDQMARYNELADRAFERGATWVVPFDADEFVCSYDGRRLADVLVDTPAEKFYLSMWQHASYEMREPNQWLTKICYRPSADTVMQSGQHGVNIPGGLHGMLGIRHLPYRSLEHFIRKVRESVAGLDPAALARKDSGHIVWLNQYSDEELRDKWNEIVAASTVYDPIPICGRS